MEVWALHHDIVVRLETGNHGQVDFLSCDHSVPISYPANRHLSFSTQGYEPLA